MGVRKGTGENRANTVKLCSSLLELSFQVVMEVFVNAQREKDTGDRVPFVGQQHLFVQANELMDVNASQVSAFHFAKWRVSDDMVLIT